MNLLTSRQVSVVHKEGARYMLSPPFHPDTEYPEYPFEGNLSDNQSNDAYALVRECLRCLGLDANRYGKRDWNPLGTVIAPGDKVVLKPNWVLHAHEGGGNLLSVVTHTSVVRAVADYALVALRGQGELILADAPLPSADFVRLREVLGLDDVVEFLRSRSGVAVELRDLRQLQHMYTEDGILTKKSRVQLSGDPAGYIKVDLGAESEFAGISDLSRLYGADYDRDQTIGHHVAGRHEYLIAGSVLEADVVISIPKLKVHRKVGATLNLKNLVGINGDKNYLPHFQVGAPSGGGDEFPDSIGAAARGVHNVRRRMVDTFLTSGNPLLERAFVISRKAYRAIKGTLGMPAEVIQAGDWYGNDTAWRMVLDLNKILHYATASGQIDSLPQRRFFSFIDGILAGEGEGPLIPDAKECGIVVAGGSPLATDLVALRMMGLDWRKLRLYTRATELTTRRLMGILPEEIEAHSNDPVLMARMKDDEDDLFALQPPQGWIGHCEMHGCREKESA